MMTFVEVGQNDDVRDPAKASHGLHRSGDRRLAVHLRLEKAQQQFPDQRPLHRLPAVLVAQRLAEAAVVHVEMDVMRSEEHTSELQSLMRISYAVFCLNKNKTLRTNIHTLTCR